MAFTWTPLSYSLGTCNPWLHRWFFLDELRFSDAVITILRKPFWSFFFLRAIENDALWPSRIQRVDYGVENVQVSDAMVEVRSESDGSFLVCSSTRNKRIERLWWDVFRCVYHLFYYVFYALEDTGLLNIVMSNRE